MKRYNPAQYAEEEHLRVSEIAARYHIGESTVRKIIRGNPKIKYLPCKDRSGRTRRTPLIPLSVWDEIYVVDMVW